MSQRLRLALGRARLFAWRFRTLEAAARAFAGTTSPLVRRRFAGALLVVDSRRSNVQRLLYLEGERFVAERRLLRSLLHPGMTVVDVGANIGYTMLLFRQAVGPGGKVVCCEPEPENLVELRRNVVANGFRNVDVLPLAVGDRDGETALAPGINAAILGHSDGGLRVPIRRLDGLLAERVDLLKIDVEGYEGHVLRGARATLQRWRPSVLVEVHPWLMPQGETTDSVLALLEDSVGPAELYELRPQLRLLDKARSRYLGSAVRRIADRAELLARCAAGERRVPFWAIARGPQ